MRLLNFRLLSSKNSPLNRKSAASGPGIRLSGFSIAENTAEGITIGTLSVFGGIGTYTFTLTNTQGARFKVAGTNGVNLQTGATNIDFEEAASYDVGIHADNGAGSTFDRTFTISIIDVSEGGSSDDDYAAWAAAA